jgi:hypothetical protein
MTEQRTPEENFPQTWWKISKYGTKIEPETVYKVTAQFIYKKYVPTSTRLDRVSRADYFHSFEEARAAKIAQLEQSIQWQKNELHRMQSALGNVKSLREPT